MRHAPPLWVGLVLPHHHHRYAVPQANLAKERATRISISFFAAESGVFTPLQHATVLVGSYPYIPDGATIFKLAAAAAQQGPNADGGNAPSSSGSKEMPI